MNFKKFYKNHSDAQDDLNLNFSEIEKGFNEMDSGNINLVASGGMVVDSSRGFRVRKYGNSLVVGYGYAQIPNQVGAILWTPPAGFAPAHAAHAVCLLEDTDTAKQAFIRFEGGRLVNAYNNWSTGKYFITFCYFTN